MTNAILLHRMAAIDSCIESIDWARELKLPDMHSAWMAMDQPQWMCWVAVRVLHAQALKAVVMSVKQLGKALPPPALASLDQALLYADGKNTDEEALLTGAFDAASTALHIAGPAGSALLAVSYTVHAAHKLRARANLASAPENKSERKRLSLKASNHVADALLHVLLAEPELADKLPTLIRGHIDERALSKAWHAIPEGPAKAAERPGR
jgi:hypothetical protein